MFQYFSILIAMECSGVELSELLMLTGRDGVLDEVSPGVLILDLSTPLSEEVVPFKGVLPLDLSRIPSRDGVLPLDDFSLS